MENWKYYEDVDFKDENIIRFNVDTRDFYCGCQKKKDILTNENLDTSVIDKYPQNKYYHTEQEVKDLLKRFWQESGGDGKWRYLALKSQNQHVHNWELKYIRIIRKEKGFLVCNDNYRILSKNTLGNPIEKEYLNFISKKDK
jgi:hypothetical protein